MDGGEPSTEPLRDERIIAIWHLIDEGELIVPGDEILARIQQLVDQEGAATSSSSSHGFTLDEYHHLFRICVIVSRWTKTSAAQVKKTLLLLLQTMRNNGVTPDQKMLKRAMDSLIKCGDAMSAIALFEDMLKEGHTPEMVGCSILLNAYCKAIRTGGLTEEQATSLAWALLEKLKEFGLTPEQTFLSILLDIMREANDNAGFLRALKTVQQYGYNFHEEVAMNIIVRAAFQFKDPLLGFEWFAKAQEMGYRPDSNALHKLLNLCDMLVEMRIRPPVEVFITLLQATIERNDRNGFFKVENAFWATRIRPNTSIWNVLIKGCGIFRHMSNIHTLLRNMQEDGDRPDATTLSNVLSACHRQKDMKTALQTFRTMKRNGVEINANHFELLLETAVQTRDERSFDEILRMLEQSQLPRNVSLAATIIWGNAKLGRFDAAMTLFDVVVNGEDVLDVHFFKKAVFACKLAKNLSRAKVIFAKMEERGIHPNEKICQLMLDIMVDCDVPDDECEEFKLQMQERYGIQLENPDTSTTNAPQPSETFSVQSLDDDI